MFSLNTELPIIYTVFCVLTGSIYAYFLYRNNKFDNKSIVRILFLIRLIVVSLLSFFLLNPFLSNLRTIEEKPIVVLAQDVSISCEDSKDSINFAILSNQLSENFDLIEYNYSDKVRPGFVSKKMGESTNISSLLDEIELNYSDRNLLALVASSDGLYNKGSNPLYHQFSKSVPIYSITIGDTSVFKDLSINNVVYNEISFLDNFSPIEVQINTQKCKGEIIDIKLYKNNKLVSTKKQKVSKSSDFIKTIFNVKNSEEGMQKYSVKLSGLKSERNLENNKYDFFVDVLNSKYKILIISDLVHPDIGAFKSVLDKNKNYQVDFSKFSEFDSDFDEYNLIVTFYLENSNSNKYKDLRNCNVPLLMFINLNSCSELNTFYSGGGLLSKNKTQEAGISYNTNFEKFNVSKSLKSFLEDLPPLFSIFGNYNVSKSADILAFQKIGNIETKKPLISLDEVLERKIAVFYGEGIWRWRMNDIDDGVFHQNFDELFSKISQYLLLKEDKSRLRINLKNKVFVGENINFKAEYYNENYELNNFKDITLKIKNGSGQEFDYLFSKNEKSSYFLNIESLPQGKYSYSANYNFSEFVKNGEFTILPKKIESPLNTANHQLLYQLSTQSGGKIFNSFDIELINQTLKNSERNKTILHSFENTNSILNNIWFLFFLIFLLSLEWIVRKYLGFY